MIRAKLARVPALRAAYDHLFAPLYLVVCSWPPVRHRLAPHLREVRTEFVYSPTGAGLNPELELHRLHGKGLIHNRDVLIVGVQMGDEILRSWLPRAPRRLIGVDLESWPDRWNTLTRSAAAANVTCALLMANGMELPLHDASVDLVSSQGVLEHITDVERFLRESWRILRPGGFIHAFFGPLWHCYGGPHIGALEYDHLLLEREQFIAKARALNTGWSYWLEKQLYNNLVLEDYLDLFMRYFRVERLALVGSPEGNAYKKAHPDRWAVLLQSARERHLLTRLVSVTARKLEDDVRLVAA